ncbi:MAG: methyltransferase domain-containing protein [Candidatus Micrarchaeota archaeon]
MEVRDLYNKVPFSAYGQDYSVLLKSVTEVPKGDAIEVGCGAGHICAYLSSRFNRVLGVDISENSIAQAKQETKSRGIKNVRYQVENLFDDGFVEKHQSKFDYVLCYGVLHHTGKPRKGYAILSKLLKSKSILTIGVYSCSLLQYRIQRKAVLLRAGDDLKRRAEVAQSMVFGGRGSDVAISDGFVNQHVSFHSIREVMGWIRENGLEYVGSHPPIELSKCFKLIFKRELRVLRIFDHNLLSYWFIEFLWAISGRSVMLNVSAKKN